jgi:hypothetical protein
VDLARSSSRIVWHELRAGVQLIRFFHNLLPMSVVHWVDADGSTNFAMTTKSSHDESINFLDDVPFVFQLIGLSA